MKPEQPVEYPPGEWVWGLITVLAVAAASYIADHGLPGL